MSATSRIVYSMARQRVAPKILGAVHPRGLTPHVAVIFAALLTHLAALSTSFFGVSDFDVQGYFGALCSFGFLTVYVLVSVAAPLYFRKTGKLTFQTVAVAVTATVFMIAPILGAIGVPGSEPFPPPTYPNNPLV